MVGPDKPAIPGQHCFEFVSSCQQGIRITCLAHNHVHVYIDSNLDTLRTEGSVPISEVDILISGVVPLLPKHTNRVLGKSKCVLFTEVSSFHGDMR